MSTSTINRCNFQISESIFDILTSCNSLHAGHRRERVLDVAKRSSLNAAAGRETGGVHEEIIDFPGALTSLLNTPDNKRLAATTIAGCENTFDAGCIAVLGCRDV